MGVTAIQKKEKHDLLKKGEKRCYTCNEIKTVDAFSPDNFNTDKLKTKCRPCSVVYQRRMNLQHQLIRRIPKKEHPKMKVYLWDIWGD